MLWPPTRPANDFCQWMVSRSSFSRNSRPSSGPVGIRFLRDARLRGCGLKSGGKDGLRGLAVGVGLEVEDDAVAEARSGDGVDVLDGEVHAPAEKRADTPAFHQGLGAPRRTAVADVFAGQRVGLGAVGLRGHD